MLRLLFQLLSVLLLFAVFTTADNKYSPENFRTKNWEPFVHRPQQCYAKVYNDLPRASIIITALDEKPGVLEENIRSLLYRTPPQLIESIIVVDDFSENAPVSPSIERQYPKVKLVRTTEPRGVAGARIAGAELATGEAVVFLDSHMEVTKGWLEPLLEYVSQHPLSVAASIIDAMEEQDGGKYLSSADLSIVTLTKTLDFKWTTQINNKNITDQALFSPVLLGSAICMMKSWWDQGRYDPGFEVWGMENIELSVRTWTCGGDIVFHPCSHVGHYYRAVREHPPKRFLNSNYVIHNAIRFADVWMDEYAKDYYASIGWPQEDIDRVRLAPDLRERRALRKSLNCLPFSAYLGIKESIEKKYNVRIPRVKEDVPEVPVQVDVRAAQLANDQFQASDVFVEHDNRNRHCQSGFFRCGRTSTCCQRNAINTVLCVFSLASKCVTFPIHVTTTTLATTTAVSTTGATTAATTTAGPTTTTTLMASTTSATMATTTNARAIGNAAA